MAALKSPADLKPLTSLRFFAAFMIFLYHLREFSPLAWLYPISGAMLHGVSFFFVLSGFVLTHVYIDRPRLPAGEFYAARLARICPTHLATLALLLAALPFAAARGQNLSDAFTALSLALKLTMLDAWIPVRGVPLSWNSVSWSISTEMAFYAAFPFLLAWVRRDWRRPLALSALLALAVYVIGLGFALPVFDPDRMKVSLYNLGAYTPPARGFEFVLGMATYVLWRRWFAPLALSRAAATACEAGVVALLALWLGFAVPGLNDALTGAPFVWFHVAGSCLIVAALIAVLAGGRGWIGAALSLRPLVWLGEISFAFYMVHVVVMRALDLRPGQRPAELAALLGSLALAASLHRGVEVPARRALLEAFRRAPSTTPRAEASRAN